MSQSLSPAGVLRPFWRPLECQPPPMLYAFTDESYVVASYLQGAYVIDESDSSQLDQIVQATSVFAERFGVAKGTELRGYSMMNSKHGWEPLREKFHARIAIYKFLLTRIAEVDGKLCFVKEIPTLSYFDESSNYSRHIVTHNHMLEKLNLMGSKYKNAGVQIIDAILYIYQRHYQINTGDRRSNKMTLELWDMVEHLLVKETP
jgi:hypothetical protein